MIEIELSNKTYRFNFKFYGKINFIIGKSGDLKTYFVEVMSDFLVALHKTKGSVKLDGKPVDKSKIKILDNEDYFLDYEVSLRKNREFIYIIDEFSKAYISNEFINLILKSNNYFIFIRRKVDCRLPVSVKSVYHFKIDGKLITNEHSFEKFNEKYFGDVRYILTEDGVSGRQFFERNFPNIEVCGKTGIIDGKKLSRDNSQLHNFLLEDVENGKDNVLIVYDSSAYAAYYPVLIEVLDECRRIGKNIRVLDWESFETYLLSLPVFNESYGTDDTGCKYNSLEQMCTIRLKELIGYNKNSLPACFNRNLECKSCNTYVTCELKKELKKCEVVVGVLQTLDTESEDRTNK